MYPRFLITKCNSWVHSSGQGAWVYIDKKRGNSLNGTEIMTNHANWNSYLRLLALCSKTAYSSNRSLPVNNNSTRRERLPSKFRIKQPTQFSASTANCYFVLMEHIASLPSSVGRPPNLAFNLWYRAIYIRMHAYDVRCRGHYPATPARQAQGSPVPP